METKKVKLSSDGKVAFHEKNHVYKKGKKKLTSVTTFLSEFFDKFDANKMAKIKAIQSKRAGIKGQGVRYWKALWDSRAEHGSHVHKMLEEFINAMFREEGVTTPPDTIEAANKYLAGVEYITKYHRGVSKPVMYTEQIVYDGDSLLAGQVDIIVSRDKDDVSNERVLDILDFKTNHKITTEGYKGKKCKNPIEYLDDCSYIKYSLQLSLYAYMLEKKGANIGNLIIIHLLEDGAHEYKVTYLKKEIEELLRWQKD